MTTSTTTFLSLYNIVSLLTLFFFVVTTVISDEQQVEPSSLQDRHHHHAIKKNILKPLMMERRNNREDQISCTIVMGRKGKHHECLNVHHQSPKSYLWRDKSLNVSAHEVPSGPNPISNR
ncbi:unnamed protein product [Withania somnifera]